VLVGDVAVLVGDVAVLVGDVAVLVGDVAVLVGDVAVLVGDVAVLVGDVVVLVVVVVGDVVVLLVGDVVVDVPVATEQTDDVMTFVSSVTAPLRANSRPWTVVPVRAEIDSRASTVPTNVVFVPRVAELPTCQKTLHAWAPLINATVLFDAVIRVLAD